MSGSIWNLVYAAALAISCFAGAAPQAAWADEPGAPDATLPAANRAEKIATFSIVALDPETGICGAAVASKYPAVGKVVPFAKGGVGAFCTQHYHHPEFGRRALELLSAGKSAQEVLLELLRDDEGAGGRQLAIIDAKGRTAQHNPIAAGERSRWWGATSGRFYACQGNTLTGPEVVNAMAQAYESTRGSLADRLVAALVAGDCAGGDHRGRLAAGIIVAKPHVDGAWLELYVDQSDDAVLDLAKKYVELEHAAKGEWSQGKLPWQHPCENRPEPQPPTPPAAARGG
ncbi:MAG: DUF1028 domain-containing protein [Pirellulales bacterium]